MAGSGVGLNARQFEKVLRHHGCTVERNSGGHVIWRAPSGAMIVATGAGRRGQVPMGTVLNAAKALGVTIRELVR